MAKPLQLRADMFETSRTISGMQNQTAVETTSSAPVIQNFLL
jgi:hypothetical protein